jgi:hypothetical protein
VTAPEQLGQTRAQALLWEIEAKDQGGGARDALKAQPAHHPRRAADGAAGHAGAGRWQLHAARAGARRRAARDRCAGGLKLALQPKLAEGLPGVRDWWARYPFACLEQKTSKAIGLRDGKLWQTVVAQLPTYLDGDGLASYFPPREGDGAGAATPHGLPAGRHARGRQRSTPPSPCPTTCAHPWSAA